MSELLKTSQIPKEGLSPITQKFSNLLQSRANDLQQEDEKLLFLESKEIDPKNQKQLNDDEEEEQQIEEQKQQITTFISEIKKPAQENLEILKESWKQMQMEVEIEFKQSKYDGKQQTVKFEDKGLLTQAKTIKKENLEQSKQIKSKISKKQGELKKSKKLKPEKKYKQSVYQKKFKSYLKIKQGDQELSDLKSQQINANNSKSTVQILRKEEQARPFQQLSSFNKKIESFDQPLEEIQAKNPKQEKARLEKIRKEQEKMEKYKEILENEDTSDEEDEYNIMHRNKLNRQKFIEEQERIRSSSFDEMQRQKERIFGKQFGAINKDSNFQITAPEPFDFDSREKNRSQYLSEQQLEMYKKEKELKENQYKNYHFTASKVPDHIHQNLYDRMVKEAEEHKKFLKDHAEAMLRYSEKPFSFEFRDQKKSKSQLQNENKKHFEYKFKANPVPWYCQELLLDKWNKEMEEKRHERMQKHAQQLLDSQQGVHNRQEEYLQKMKDEPPRERKLDNQVFSFQPKINKSGVPDFKKLQSDFKSELDAKRSKFMPTNPKGLSIKWQSSKKPKQQEALQQDLYYQTRERQKKRPKSAKDDPIKRAEKIKNSKPKYQAGSTKKFEALVDLRQREREQEFQNYQIKEKEKIYRDYKKALLAPRVQQSLAMQYSVDQQEMYKSKMLDTYKQQSRIIQKKWEDEMAEIMERVHNRPLLCEIVSNKFQENYYDMQEQYYQDHQPGYYNGQINQEIKEVDQEAEQEMDTEQKDDGKSAKKIESKELLPGQENQLHQQYYENEQQQKSF